MKTNELLESDGGNLIGKTVKLRGKPTLITEDTPNTTWDGKFAIVSMGVTDLTGCPKHVHGDFDAGRNPITSLRGSPRTVSGSFSVDIAELRTLDGAPESVGPLFSCTYNHNLKSLEGAPVVNGKANRYTGQNVSLINASFCRGIVDMHDVHRHLKTGVSNLRIPLGQITSCVLGLLLVPGLNTVSDDASRNPLWLKNPLWLRIIRPYLHARQKFDGGSRGRVVHCQNELFDAGLDEYAKL